MEYAGDKSSKNNQKSYQKFGRSPPSILENITKLMVGHNAKGDGFDFSLNLEVDDNVDPHLLIFIFAIIKTLKLVSRYFCDRLS